MRPTVGAGVAAATITARRPSTTVPRSWSTPSARGAASCRPQREVAWRRGPTAGKALDLTAVGRAPDPTRTERAQEAARARGPTREGKRRGPTAVARPPDRTRGRRQGRTAAGRLLDL